MSTKIEAITVCIGYADFLRETLRANLPLLDDMLVVTAPDDAETINVCRQNSVRYVMSTDHTRDGPLNKGRAINRALDSIGGHDWVLHLDADIVLPQKFRQYVEWAHLDERTLYGADRCNMVGFDKWANLKRYVGAWNNHAYGCGHWFHPECQVGSRWVSKEHGYCPIGYFQLFHGQALVDNGYHVRTYPITHGDAARSDVQFALQYDRQFRQVLPEVIVLHLESEPSALGANWKGRTTPRFGPTPVNMIAPPLAGATVPFPQPQPHAGGGIHPDPPRPPHRQPEPPHHHRHPS